MNAVKKQFLSLYIESNPNPNSLKFVINYMMLPPGQDVDFENAEQAKNSPLAQELFKLPYVERVFIMSNFFTVTKSNEVSWENVVEEVKMKITDWLKSDKPVFLEVKEEVQYDENEPEINKKIRSLLDEYVRPAVESDGGAINFSSYEDGLVKVELRGSCSGCPSSTYTLKAGIENLLKRFLPEEVKAVEAVSM